MCLALSLRRECEITSSSFPVRLAMAAFETFTSDNPAAFSFVRSSDAPIALEPIPASQAKTTWVVSSLDIYYLPAAFIAALDATASDSAPFSSVARSRARVARMITPAIKNETVAERSTDRITPRYESLAV